MCSYYLYMLNTNISYNYSYYLLMDLITFSYHFSIDTTVMLYTSSNASGNGYQTQLFDSKLGAFMPGTFVLSYQYMFIQVSHVTVI